MSETDTATPAENTGEGSLSGDTVPEVTDNSVQPGDEQPDNPAAAAKGRENSKLRQRLRTTTARLETMQRRDVERLAAVHLQDGADIWRDGLALADALTEDGDVDPGKVAELAKAVLASHGHWRRQVPSAPPASTVTSDGKITGGGNTFIDAFRPRNG